MSFSSTTLQRLGPALALALALSTALPLPALAGGKADGHSHGPSHGMEETAIGKPGVAGKVNRTITIVMHDTMRFVPERIQVRQGETIRFALVNKGKVRHELSLGTEQELKERAELMKKFPTMEHDEPNSLTLDPGKRGAIIWQFTRAGTVQFACLMPGHFEAGMQGAVQVGKR